MNDDGKIQIAIRFKSRSTILFDYWNIRLFDLNVRDSIGITFEIHRCSI